MFIQNSKQFSCCVAPQKALHYSDALILTQQLFNLENPVLIGARPIPVRGEHSKTNVSLINKISLIGKYIAESRK